MFDSHLADLESIKVVRCDLRQDPLDCPANGSLSVETEDARFDFSQAVKVPSHSSESSIQLAAIQIVD